jgi:membrane protease YdiL (CAAX protease family)
MADRDSPWQIATYLFLTLAFSSLFYFLILHAHRIGAAGGLYVSGIMWCPALAALATLKLYGRPLKELRWKWPAAKYAWMSWWIPLSYTAITYIILWSTGLGGVPNRQFMAHLVTRMGLRSGPILSTVVYLVLTGTFGLVGNLSTALGEEIGWRGFLVPELFRRTGYTVTAVVSGLVWACWHFPILIWGDYNAGTPTWYGLTCFTVLLVAVSFIFAWLTLKSASLWAGAILHASHNLYIQDVFTPMTLDKGKTAWFMDEFGAILPVVAIGFAIYFWRRRHELQRD